MSNSMWSEAESEIKLFRFFHQMKPIYITKRIATTQNLNTNWFHFIDHKSKDTDILFKEPLTEQIAELVIKKTPLAYEVIEYKDKARRKKEIVSREVLARKAYADLIKPYIAFDSITD